MNLLKNITITIPSVVIQELVEKHLQSEGWKIRSFKFNVETRFEGYGPNEHEVAHFAGITCEVDRDK